MTVHPTKVTHHQTRITTTHPTDTFPSSMDYSDIINLPHPEPRQHPRMSMYQRAAQFAPFAALNGHGDAIQETARLTDRPIELSEQERSILDAKMQELLSLLHTSPMVTITHFVADNRKKGGAYQTTVGHLKKWDEYRQVITLDGDMEIHLFNIISCNIVDDE